MNGWKFFFSILRTWCKAIFHHAQIASGLGLRPSYPQRLWDIDEKTFGLWWAGDACILHKACLPEGLRGTSKYFQIFPNIGTSKYFQILARPNFSKFCGGDKLKQPVGSTITGLKPIWQRCEDDFHVFFNSGWDYQIVEFTRAVWKMVFIHDQIITIWRWSNFADQTNVIKDQQSGEKFKAEQSGEKLSSGFVKVPPRAALLYLVASTATEKYISHVIEICFIFHWNIYILYWNLFYIS